MAKRKRAKGESEAPETDAKDADREGGNVTPTADGADGVAVGAGAREASPVDVTDRLRRERRWADAEPRKNQLIREYHAAGMTRAEAKLAAYAEIARLYPPMPAPGPLAVPVEADSGRVVGLGDIPPDWPTLPPNASMAAEIQWVQASRVDVLELLPSGGYRAHLGRADQPAPSKAALSWLETCALYGSKWADIVAKATTHAADARESVRRERVAIEELRGLLAEAAEPTS